MTTDDGGGRLQRLAERLRLDGRGWWGAIWGVWSLVLALFGGYIVLYDGIVTVVGWTSISAEILPELGLPPLAGFVLIGLGILLSFVVQ